MMQFTIPPMTYMWTVYRGKRPVKSYPMLVIGGYTVYKPGHVHYNSPLGERARKYVAWKNHCQRYAEIAGLKLPWSVSKARAYRVCTRVWFPGAKFPDPENVRKSIVDALVYVPKGLGKRRGDDAWCGGYHELPMFSTSAPRVEVAIFTPSETREMLDWIRESMTFYAESRKRGGTK